MEGERNVARKMARYMWRVKRSIWEMERQIPSLLELGFRIQLAKIAKGRSLSSLLRCSNTPTTSHYFDPL